LLIAHFLADFKTSKGFNIQGISDDALERLQKYPWPGNVRELRNVIERLVVIHPDRMIGTDELPARIKGASPHISTPLSIKLSDEGICLNSAISDFERTLILQSLEKTKWVKNRAAQLLHLKRTTLVEKIKRHRITPDTTQ
jgi:DNA-binding NtrC family response regulator